MWCDLKQDFLLSKISMLAYYKLFNKNQINILKLNYYLIQNMFLFSTNQEKANTFLTK